MTLETPPSLQEDRAALSGADKNDLPDSAFAAIEPGGKKDASGRTTPRSLRHLPYKDENGKLDEGHVRNALARLSQTKISASLLAQARAKIYAAARKLGIEVSDDQKRAVDAAIVAADPDLYALVEAQMALRLADTVVYEDDVVAAAHEMFGGDQAGDQTGDQTGESAGDQTRSVGFVDTAQAPLEGNAVRVLYAPITRIDEEKREVEGVVTSEGVDTFGTIFDYPTMKDVMQRAWLGNVREQHDPRKAVGTRVHVTFDDERKIIRLRSRISKGAEDTWQKVQDGTLRGYSIGASDCTVKERRMVNGRSVPVLAPSSLAEVSLVDAPSNPDAAQSGLILYRAQGEMDDATAAIFDALDETASPSTSPSTTPEGDPPDMPDMKANDTLTRAAAAALEGQAQEREITAADGLVGYDLGSSAPCCHGGGTCPPDCDCGAGCECRSATPDQTRVSHASEGETVSDGVDTAQANDRGGVYPEDTTTPKSGTGAGSADEAVISPADFDDSASGGSEFGTQTGERGGEGTVAAPETQDEPRTQEAQEDGQEEGEEATETPEEAESAPEPEIETRASLGGDYVSRQVMSKEDLRTRDDAISAAESGMAGESGHAHGQHDHPHANDYEVVHDHSHSHTHQDGTSHTHPHMHAHAHHDHDGTDMGHGHPHSHTHDHSHEYRVSAPDISLLQEPTMDEWRARRAQEAEEQRVAQAQTQAQTQAQAQQTQTQTPPPVVEHPTTENRAGAGTETQEAQETRAQETQETVQTAPVTATRAGSRISTATRAGLHEAIVRVASTCDCPACRDAQSCYDPDHDGDDDTTPEGDTDHDMAGNTHRVQTPSAQLTRRAQRLQIAKTTRAVLEAELPRLLAPILQRFDAVAAQLATVSPVQTGQVTELAPAESVSNSVEERMTGMASSIDTVRSSLEGVQALLTQIASAPMPGGPILQANTGAVTRYLPTDPRAMQRTQQATIAEAVETLRDAGILKPEVLAQGAQIDAATAMITAGIHGTSRQ